MFFRMVSTRIGAVNISLVTLLQPVSAVFLGWLVLGEAIDRQRIVAGMAVIALGLLCVDGRLAAPAVQNR